METQPTYEELLAANKCLHASNLLLQETNTELQERLSEKESDILQLKHQIAKLREKLFGKSSEKLSKEEFQQLSMFLEELSKELEAAEQEQVEVSSYKRGKKSSKPLPEDLPRERVEHEPDEKTCPCCGDEKAKIGEETTEVLEFIPAQFKVIEHVKIKRACSKCKSGAVTAKLPEGSVPIEGARVGYGLLAYIIVSKYADHLPLHRQEQIFLRQGVDIPRQRMCDWIGIVTERYLLALCQALKRKVLKSDYIKADETRINVQDIDKTGWLWGMQSEEGDVYFEYNESRGGSVAADLFAGYEGIVQTDLYAGYNPVFLPETTQRAGCWAHARRKFLEAEESHKKECGVVLKLISKLYAVEKSLRGKPLEDVGRKRGKESRVLIEKLESYLREQEQTQLPKSPFVKAARYSLKQWNELTLFLSEPRLKLDNNDIERQMRPVAVGRHNWLFAGSQRGAEWAACMFSIFGTCRMHKINPYEYLLDVLKKLPITKQKDIDKLLPRAWKEARGM